MGVEAVESVGFRFVAYDDLGGTSRALVFQVQRGRVAYGSGLVNHEHRFCTGQDSFPTLKMHAL